MDASPSELVGRSLLERGLIKVLILVGAPSGRSGFGTGIVAVRSSELKVISADPVSSRVKGILLEIRPVSLL